MIVNIKLTLMQNCETNGDVSTRFFSLDLALACYLTQILVEGSGSSHRPMRDQGP